MLTTAEVAAWVQVSEYTLRSWRYQGVGPLFQKLGRHVRYRPAEVEQWVASQTPPRIRVAQML